MSEILEERKPVEHYSSKDLLKPEVQKGFSSGGAGRHESFRKIGKKLFKSSFDSEEPVTYREPMLRIKHSSIKNKTLTVGSTIFLFKGDGIAMVSQKNQLDWAALLRRPGYSNPDMVVPVPVMEVVEEKSEPTPKKKVIAEIKVPEEKLEELDDLEFDEDLDLDDSEFDEEPEPTPKKKVIKKSGRKTRKTKKTTK